MVQGIAGKFVCFKQQKMKNFFRWQILGRRDHCTVEVLIESNTVVKLVQTQAVHFA